MVPPAGQAESCATGSQCDDTGRCVSPGQQLTLTAVMSATPSTVVTVPGGPAQTFSAKLTAFSSTAAVTSAGTAVRVVGRDGALVSCDATTYAAQCAVTSWTFAFDGKQYNASHAVQVKTPTGTPDGHGEVELRIDATDSSVIVPANASATALASDGEYDGTASFYAIPGGVHVTARAAGNYIVIRDPSRTLSANGFIVVDRTQFTARSVAWVQPVGANASTPGVAAALSLRTATVTNGQMHLMLDYAFSSSDESMWPDLVLNKTGSNTPQCAVDADCGIGNSCPAALHACVPTAAWNPSTTLTYNQFEDARSVQWWNAMTPALGDGTTVTGAANPAFATTNAGLIESLMCTTAAGPGHLGLSMIEQAGQFSHSGDLQCVSDATGAPNGSTGAVGLVTSYDRTGTAVSSDLLAACLQDLARPVTNSFAVNFATTTGACVNLARVLPALRLLATGELHKGTQVTYVDDDIREVGLVTRLVQQWTSLTGFIASTGLSQRELDDANGVTPGESRQGLISILDTVDAGWAALMDKRVAPLVAEAVTQGNEDFDSYVANMLDYRTAKQPFLYWPFNDDGTGLVTDVIRHVTLGYNYGQGCEGNDPGDTYLRQGAGCAAYAAQVSSEDVARLQNFRHETVLFNLNAHEPMGYGPDDGGMIYSTAQLAVYQRYDDSIGDMVLTVVHPTGGTSPGYERIEFAGLGDLWHDLVAGNGYMTTLAIVRDTVAKTYTLYRWENGWTSADVYTKPYQHDVSGALTNLAPNQVMVLGGPAGCLPWYNGPSSGCFNQAFYGSMDDLAIFDAKYSDHELQTFINQRDRNTDGRVIWPATPTWDVYGTQDETVPLGAALLQAQSAELDVAARLVDHMSYETQAACAGHDASAGTDLDAIVARVSRVVRQSVFVEWLAANDSSAQATDQRTLFWGKRSALIQSLRRLTSCVDPYGIGDNEVPLYFGGIAPPADEKAAFFAASDYMLTQAETKANAAKAALDALRTAWNNARLSQIQQLEDSNQRQIRLDDLATRYGEDLRRLCGISDQTAQQVVDGVLAGTFHVNSCFVAPGSSCAANLNQPIKNADPTCFRGVIGSAVLDIQSAYKASDTAYQAWQVASDNAAAAQRVCVLKEIDLFGCSALDRHDVTGVTCPAGFQGTIDLVAAYNKAAADHEADKGFFSSIVNIVKGMGEIATGVGIAIATGGVGAPAIGAGLLGAADLITAGGSRMDDSIDAQKRDLDALLQARSAEDSIRSCWEQSDQYQRAISVAQLSFKESTAKVQSALLAFQNAASAASADVLQAPASINQEQNRPALPIAFNYWVPQNYAAYKTAFDTARRYTYIALRATEYDMQDSYATAQAGKPSRGEVLGSWSPDTLIAQLQLMRNQTGTRKLANGRAPALEHMAFDLGAKFFGLDESDVNFGHVLASYARPVYSTHGEYLGLGVRFSLVPETTDEAPTWRCGERIWRVNVGASGMPSSGDGTHVKLLKSNTFASRLCDRDGFQSATLRPSVNLLAESGDPATYQPEDASTPADVRLTDFSLPDTFTNFKFSDTYLNGSSSELALEGMYGDYVLLFPAAAFTAGLDLTQLHDFLLRFDFLSADNTPATPLAARRSPSVKLDPSPASIVVRSTDHVRN